MRNYNKTSDTHSHTLFPHPLPWWYSWHNTLLNFCDQERHHTSQPHNWDACHLFYYWWPNTIHQGQSMGLPQTSISHMSQYSSCGSQMCTNSKKWKLWNVFLWYTCLTPPPFCCTLSHHPNTGRSYCIWSFSVQIDLKWIVAQIKNKKYINI